ncbi:MAG: DNA translocase FtsK 4TM domain-containing protein, partial [Alistipes sp.]|nr:DNA translocase FtsK 4TM domain-containing protein [Alistipes sp.]
MAQQNRDRKTEQKSNPAKSSAPKTERKKFRLSDNQKWVAGLVLFFFALFTLWACVSYFFTWNAHSSGGLDWLETGGAGEGFRSAAAAVSAGEKGTAGQRWAELLVGDGFGVFALSIPVMLIIIGLRLMRFRPPLLERSVRIAFVAMILGSVSLGLAFDTDWGVFGTGLGGAQGIFAAEWLHGKIGLVGSGLMLLCLWILLAVYISRKNIARVNRVGRALVDGGAKVGGLVTGLAGGGTLEEEESCPGEGSVAARSDGGAGGASRPGVWSGGVAQGSEDEYYDDGEDENTAGAKGRFGADGRHAGDSGERPRNEGSVGADGLQTGERITLNDAFGAGDSPFVVRDIAGGHTVEVTKPGERPSGASGQHFGAAGQHSGATV